MTKTTDANNPTAPTDELDPTVTIALPKILIDQTIRALNRIPNRRLDCSPLFKDTYALVSALEHFVRGTEQIAQCQVFGSTEDPETCPECGRRGVYFGEENEHYASGSSGGSQDFWCVGCGYHWLMEHD